MELGKCKCILEKVFKVFLNRQLLSNHPVVVVVESPQAPEDDSQQR